MPVCIVGTDYIYGGNVDNKIRINKYLSEAGICSRREADRLIEAGRVMINDTVAECGMKVSENDVVYFNKKRVTLSEKPVVLIYNKPKGVVCSTKEKDNIIDYINYPKRIYPVGRLDKDSTGLILLTNQGSISDAMLRASNYHEKEYHVKVNMPITKEFVEGMRRGVPILDTVTRPCKIKVYGEKEFSVILTQGLNRQIRRMCEYFDYRVRSLERVRIMNIKLGDLKPGEYIEMSDSQINDLKRDLGILN